MATKEEREKQDKILKILDLFSKKQLEKITEDDFKFDTLPRYETAVFMEAVWVAMGKEQGNEEELKQGFAETLTLAHILLFMRLGLVKINKDGNPEKTKLGKVVEKELLKESE